MTNKKKPTTYRVGFHDYLILQRIIGGKCKFRIRNRVTIDHNSLGQRRTKKGNFRYLGR